MNSQRLLGFPGSRFFLLISSNKGYAHSSMKNIYLFALAAISLFALSSCGKPSHESVREAEIEILEEVAEIFESVEAVSYTHSPSPRDGLLSRMPSSA